MKNFYLLAIALLSITFSNAQEQAIKVNPVGLAFGIANAGFEFATTNDQTLTLSALYYNVSDASGFGAGADYRFYFSTNEALRGWHAGPSVGFVSLEDDFSSSADFFIVGGGAGHQWIFGEHFALDIFAGLGYVIGDSDDLAVTVDSLSVSLGVAIGYAW